MADPATPFPNDADGWAVQAEARLLDVALASPPAAWDRALFDRAAKASGLSSADAGLLAPHGAQDLAALLWRRHDARALAALAERDAGAMKVRDRIRVAVEARIEAALQDEAAVRAANLFMARPANAALTLRLGWASADQLWRWAGDAAADENHYTKRAILSAILAGVLAVRLMHGPAAARTYLDRRIEQVMAFESWKAKLPPPIGGLYVLASSLGRLRYGPRS